MKKRIYVPVMLVLLVAVPQLALAAGPSDVAVPVCDAQSHVLAYPTANIEANIADCIAEYIIAQPVADFEGDGISYYGQTATSNSPTNLAEETELGRVYSYGTGAHWWRGYVDQVATRSYGTGAHWWRGYVDQVATRNYGTGAHWWRGYVD